MNDMQHDQLFTDLSPEQTELASGGGAIGLGSGSSAGTFANLQRQALSSSNFVRLQQRMLKLYTALNLAKAANSSRTEMEKLFSDQARQSAHG